MVIREEREKSEEQKWEARLLILYGLDYREHIYCNESCWRHCMGYITVNTYNSHWRREREKSEEQKWEARLLILYGLDYREHI